MVKDPVCKMSIDEDKTTERSEYKGKTYFFCAAGCRERFENDPEKYLEGDKEVDWIKGDSP